MANKVNINNNDDFEQQLDAYMQHMDDELSAAEQLIQDMQNENKLKQPILSKMNNGDFGGLTWMGNLEYQQWQSMHQLTQELRQKDPNCTGVARAALGITNWSEAVVYNTSNFIQKFGTAFPTFAGYLKQLQSIDNKIKSDESQLEAIDPNINLTLVNQLNELLAQTDSLSEQNLQGDDLNRAVQQATEIFSQLCDVLMDTIRADLAQAGMKQFGQSSDPRASAAILQFAGIAIQAETEEQFSLQSVQTDVMNDEMGWQKEKSSAEADLKTGHWYDFFTGGGPDSGKDHAQIRAANAMIGILNGIEKMISPLISVVDPGMQEFKIELDELKKKFQSLITNGGSLREMQDAMVEALSILVGIIAETTKDASMYDKEMNQGSLATSQMQMNDSLSQEEVIVDAKKYASIMGKLITVAKYLGMALIFLVNPGVAMALMMGLEAALTASGVMDKLQNALSDKFGDVGGAAMMCGIEVIGTAGGAAAIEAALGAAAKAAAKAAEEVVEKTVEAVIEKTAQGAENAAAKIADAATSAARAGGATEEEALQIGMQASAKSMTAVRTVVEKTVDKAVETAQKKVTLIYMSKTFTELMSSIVKGDLKEMMEVAMKQAAENAGKSEDLAALMETAANQSSADVVGEEEITSIARKAADDAVASAAKVSKESISKIDRMNFAGKDLGEKTAGTKAMVRGGFAGVAAMGSTGLPTDLTALMQGKDKDDLSEGWQTAMEVIQMLMQFIGMLGQTDIGAQSVLSMGNLNKFLLGTSVASSGLEAVGDAGVSAADYEQAGAVQAIAKDQSILDMMQFVMSQLKKEGQLTRDQYAKAMQQTSKTNMDLAMHFTDADQEIARSLAVLPV